MGTALGFALGATWHAIARYHVSNAIGKWGTIVLNAKHFARIEQVS
jgi:hypothetical protein